MTQRVTKHKNSPLGGHWRQGVKAGGVGGRGYLSRMTAIFLSYHASQKISYFFTTKGSHLATLWKPWGFLGLRNGSMKQFFLFFSGFSCHFYKTPFLPAAFSFVEKTQKPGACFKEGKRNHKNLRSTVHIIDYCQSWPGLTAARENHYSSLYWN